MTAKETAEIIRKELKKLGYGSNKLSVRSGYRGYSAFVDVTVKFPIEGIARENEELINIKRAIRKFEEIDRCDVSGEILQGGNTYINLLYNGYII